MGFFDIAKTVAIEAAGFIPVVGTVISVYNAVGAIRKGNYGEAAIELLGIVPLGKVVGKVAKGVVKVAEAGVKIVRKLNTPRLVTSIIKKVKPPGIRSNAPGLVSPASNSQALNAFKDTMKKEGKKNVSRNDIKSEWQVKGSIEDTKKIKNPSKGKTEGGKPNNKPQQKPNNKPQQKPNNKPQQKPNNKPQQKPNNKPQQKPNNKGKEKLEDHKQSNQIDEKKVKENIDPINVVTGSFDVKSIDLVVEDRGQNISLRRDYNSRDASIGVFGLGWSFEYETKVLVDDEEAMIVYPYGNYKIFNKIEGKWKNSKSDDESHVFTEYDDKYTLKVENEKLYTYDLFGKLILVSDNNHNTIKIEYDDNDNISTIISPGEKIVHFKYYYKKIIEIIDNIGRKLSYKYDEDKLVEVEFPNDGVVTYEYKDDLIVSVTDQAGIEYVRNEYDHLKRVVKQYDRENNLISILYNEKNKITKFITETTGLSKSYRYNEKELVVEEIYDDGTSVKYTYDEYENKSSETDGNGNTTKWIYNNKGNVLEEISPNGHIIYSDYDSNGNCIKIFTSSGKETLFSYDNKGNLIEKKTKISDVEFVINKYTYDGYGRLLSETDSEDNTVRYEYDHIDLDNPTKIIDGENNVFIYEYDEAGRNTAITTSYGTLRFGYNVLNKKTHIIDDNGNVTRLIYNKMGKLIKKVLPKEYNSSIDNGKGYEYRYDAFDRLIKSIDPLKNITALKYDLEGNVVKEINSNYYNRALDDGLGLEYIYDGSDRRVKTIYPTGGISRTKYDIAGNITKVINANNYNPESDNGKGLEYTYDSLNRLTSIKDAEGNIIKKYIYDIQGHLIKEIDAKGYLSGDSDEKRYGILYKYNIDGWLLEKRIPVKKENSQVLYNIITYKYNKNGDKIEENRSSEYVTETSYPKAWHSISYTYDKNNRVISIKDSIGAEIEYTYDCLNNKTSEKVRINDEKFKVTKYKYNSIGLLEKVIRYIDGEDSDCSEGNKVLSVATYEHDKNGNVNKIVSPEGNTTEIYYDILDRIHQITETNKDEEHGRITLFKYDSVGNLIKETDCNNNSIIYEYDSMNRLIKTTDKEGGITRYFYDNEGNLIKTISPEEYNLNGENGKGTSISYDYLNRITQVKNALGIVVQNNKFNISGEIIEELDQLNRKVNYIYDIGGRRRETVIPLGATKKISQEYIYDSIGNIIGLKDSEGNSTEFELDLWGRIEKINKADNTTEKYTYDYAGNITTTTDGNGNTIEYKFNSLNLLGGIIDQAGDAELFKYNKEARLSNHIDRNKNVVEYLYNIDGNLTKRQELNSGLVEEYLYNKDRSLRQAKSGSNIYTYEYTKNLNLKSKSINGQQVLGYKYNKNNNIIELTDVLGQPSKYSYDALDRLTKVSRGNKESAIYTYNNDNTISSLNYGNGISVDYNYDAAKNITEILAKDKDNKEVFSNTYTYDSNGNRTSKAENGEITKYIYDSVNRLEKVEYPNYIEEFSYDAARNRLSKTSNNILTNYSYDIRNRLCRKIELGILTNYTYDKQGNLIKEVENSDETSYVYDGFNRAIKVEKSNRSYQINSYNPEGLRSEVNENGTISKFIYNDKNVVTELDEDNNLKESILRGLEIVSKIDREDNPYYYLTNAHGDTVNISDEYGDVVNTYDYDAFGNITSQQEKVNNRFKYAGEQYDTLTGQYYLRARFYNPVIGRFTQEDVYRGDGLNLYAYVGNNPINYIDPSGYCKSKENINQGPEKNTGNNKKEPEIKETQEKYKNTGKNSEPNKGNGETKYEYNMVENPGPLADIEKNPASNFASGKYNVEVLKEDKIYYRAGESGKPLGQWFTSEPAESVAKVRVDLAVKDQWIDPKTGIVTGTSTVNTNYSIKIPAGTTVYTGPVGYQGGIYLGGQNQIQTFIQTPWKLCVEVVGSKPLK